MSDQQRETAMLVMIGLAAIGALSLASWLLTPPPRVIVIPENEPLRANLGVRRQ